MFCVDNHKTVNNNMFILHFQAFTFYFLIILVMHVTSVTPVVSDSVTLWTVAQQAPLSMGFSRQEYWSGLLCSLFLAALGLCCWWAFFSCPEWGLLSSCCVGLSLWWFSLLVSLGVQA